MAMSLNRAQLIGNLTRDPELKQLPSGQAVATFSIATNFVWTDQNGQKQEKAEFHNIVAWRRLAEICGQYLKKGSKIFIEGRLQTRDWQGEDGVKRYRTEIVADSMIMLDRQGNPVAGGGAPSMAPPATTGGNLGSAPRAASGGAPAAANAEKEEVTIDDLPF